MNINIVYYNDQFYRNSLYLQQIQIFPLCFVAADEHSVRNINFYTQRNNLFSIIISENTYNLIKSK